MQAHEPPQVTLALAPFPLHTESQAPWPHCSVAVWHVESAEHSMLHGALVGQVMAAPWQADALVHWMSHADPVGQVSVAAWQAETPPHSITQRIPSGHATVPPWQAEVALQSMVQRSFVQPPVHAAGHVVGATEVPAGQEPPPPPPSAVPPSTAQMGPHAPWVQG